jgi:hypothetical protein
VAALANSQNYSSKHSQSQHSSQNTTSKHSHSQHSSQNTNILPESQQEDSPDPENSQDSIFGAQDSTFDLALIAAATTTEATWITQSRSRRKQRSSTNTLTCHIVTLPGFWLLLDCILCSLQF